MDFSSSIQLYTKDTSLFKIVKNQPGTLFEQWVGQELWKRIGYLKQGKLFHFRSKEDYIIYRCKRPMQICDGVKAMPYWYI